jgi:hypothetical protein
VAAETWDGWLSDIDGRTVHALPHDRLVEALQRYGRAE